MPKFLSRLIFSFFSNLIALWAAVYFIKGFEIAPDFIKFSWVAAIFTLLNIFIRPILKLILTPLIIITLGLGIIVVNAAVLYLLDFLSPDITITGLMPLFYATLLISLVNILISLSAKRVYREA